MYCGFNKDGGGIIGEIQQGTNSADWSEVEDTTSAEESVVVYAQNNLEDDDENQNLGEEKIVLTSRLDPYSGNLVWQPCADQSLIMKRTVGMSQVKDILKVTFYYVIHCFILFIDDINVER